MRSASAAVLRWPGAIAVRFAILGILLFGTTLYAGMTLSLVGRDVLNKDDPFGEVQKCVTELAALVLLQGSLDAASIAKALSDCLMMYASAFVAGAVGLLLLTLAVALALYALLPVWTRYRAGINRSSTAPPRELTRWVDETINEAGLAGRVKVRWRIVDPRPNASVFGAFGRSELILCGGLLGRALTDEQHARETLRHELAHIKNGDVHVILAARSLWLSFLLCVLLPVVAFAPWLPSVEGGGSSAFDVVRTVAQFGLIGVAVFAARNLVVQEVEHRADLGSGSTDFRHGQTRRYLPAWAYLHPPEQARKDVVWVPARLLRARPAELFLTGVVLGLSLPLLASASVCTILVLASATDLNGQSFSLVLALIAPFWLGSGAVAMILTHLVVRDRTAAILGQGARSTAMIVLVIVAGMIAGLAVAPVVSIALPSQPNLASFISAALPQLELLTPAKLATMLTISATAAVAALAISVWWLLTVSDAWMAKLLSVSSPRLILHSGAIIAAFAIGPMIASVLYMITVSALHSAAGFGLTSAPTGALPLLVGVMSLILNPLNILGILLLSFIPLLALPWQKEQQGLLTPLSPDAVLRVPNQRPSAGVLVGSVVLVGTGLFLTFYTPWSARVVIAIAGHLMPDPNSELVGYIFYAFAMSWVVVVSIGAALLAPRLPFAHGAAVCGVGGLGLFLMAYPRWGLTAATLTGNAGGWLALIVASLPIFLLLTLRALVARCSAESGHRRSRSSAATGIAPGVEGHG